MYVSAAACTRSQCRQISQPPPSASPAGAATTGTGDIFSADRRALERADHQVDFVPVALLRLEQEQHQVRAGREEVGLGADDERREVPRRLVDAGEDHLDRVAADRVQLRVELDAEHAVAEIDEARAGVLSSRRRDAARAVLSTSAPASTGGSAPALNRRPASARPTERGDASSRRRRDASRPIASNVSNGPSSQP